LNKKISTTLIQKIQEKQGKKTSKKCSRYKTCLRLTLPLKLLDEGTRMVLCILKCRKASNVPENTSSDTLYLKEAEDFIHR